MPALGMLRAGTGGEKWLRQGHKVWQCLEQPMGGGKTDDTVKSWTLLVPLRLVQGGDRR